jgi:hypothetical protein
MIAFVTYDAAPAGLDESLEAPSLSIISDPDILLQNATAELAPKAGVLI